MMLKSLENIELNKGNDIKSFLNMGSYNDDDIKEPGLQKQGVKALYLEGKDKYTQIQILFYPKSGY